MTDDLISRKAAIDVVHHTIYEFFDVVEDDDESPITYKDMKLLELNKSISTRVKNLPSAPRWIPVTERLPEENKDKEEEIDVLCFTIHQTMLVASYGKLYPLSDEVGWITNEYNRLDVSSVLAWMPLPKPWKGE